MEIETGTLKAEILQFPKDVARWDLVRKFYEFRRKMFVERMGWKLDDFEEMEFEQYDGFETTYAVAHVDGEVLGGGRLRRTDQRNGIYSYMIRDAVLGLLPSLPTNLLYREAPVDQVTWELTRFATDGKGRVAEALLYEINGFLKSRGATGCLCLGPPAFLRMAKKFSWYVEQMGPICANEDGRFLVFRLSITDPATLAPGSLHKHPGAH